MVEAMSDEDLVFIATSLFPSMEKTIVHKMVAFNNKVVVMLTIFSSKIASVGGRCYWLSWQQYSSMGIQPERYIAMV